MLISAEEARSLYQPTQQLNEALSLISATIEAAARQGLPAIKVYDFGFDSLKHSAHDLCTPLQASIIDSLKEKGYKCYLEGRALVDQPPFLLVSWSN